MLRQTSADPQTSSPELPAHEFQAKSVLTNDIVNLGIKKKTDLMYYGFIQN